MFYYDFETLKKDSSANFGRPYRQCELSVMDTIGDPNISFDKDGVCNYFFNYKKAEDAIVKRGVEGEKIVEELIQRVKKGRARREYDCITGVSGGVDSTYLVLQLFKLGLRPLIVHFDNGWNSETAVRNIENIIAKTGFALYTLVVNWEEFKDIQRSYFKASVVDIEVATDQAIRATLSKLASKHGLKYIFSGDNVVTEAVLPSYWVFNKSDHVNLRGIHARYGTVPIRTFPLFDYKLKMTEIARNIQVVTFLNYLPYVKAEAKKAISENLGWKDYGGKHYESVFTKFYQAYILPRKFKIDKRKAHLSNLIFSGQMTKQEALKELDKPLYDEKELENDYEFVTKKLSFSRDEFEAILSQPRTEHDAFPVEVQTAKKFWYLKPLKHVKNLVYR
jgi:N-acetyl sugar amidotransferase